MSTEPPRWDHVVVGAGSAGAVLAARLSERAGCRVLLLDAGPADDLADPALRDADFTAALAVPGRTWDGLVARLSRATGLRPYVRGRGVGGSAAVNAMIALRGVPDDYDRWAARGADGWAWTDVRPVFERLERSIARTTVPEAHWGAVDRGLREAAVALGLRAEAATLTAEVGEDGTLRRSSPVHTHLLPALARPGSGLAVRGGALVDRVEFAGGRRERRACGVRLAGGEVIEAAHVTLCAGAIHTPAILLRSGVDRPGIGANLQDHPAVRVVLALRPEAHRRPGDPAVSCLVPVSVAARDDVQVLPLARVGSGADGRALGALMVAAMHVESRGRVVLASADPTVDPSVDFDLLGDERDLALLRAGVGHLFALARHPAITSTAERVLVDDAGTPLDALLAGSAADLDAWILRTVGDYVHAAGTCRMGSADDPLAVVDPGCRVIGHEGLAVVDASVMPEVPRANTHLPTMMVAEKVAPSLGR